MTIVTDSEMGGDARIAGTRIAVYHIVQYHDAGFDVMDIADEFRISVEEVRDALEYAREHPEQMDERSATDMLRCERELNKRKLDEKYGLSDDDR